jgi:WD40 repeat protein
MSRSVQQAHYQHGRKGLTLVVRPPVHDVAAMAWAGHGRLVVGTSAGSGYVVHPALGTGELWTDRAPVLGIGVDGGRVAVVEGDGSWRMLDLDGNEAYAADHGFIGAVDVQFDGSHVLLTGPTASDRRTVFYQDGRKVFRILMPHRTVALIDHEREIALAQSTPDGLEVLRVAPGARFRRIEQTAHVLSVASGRILGVHDRGVRVWRPETWDARDVQVSNATVATLSGDGRYAAIGTSSGGVAVVDLEDAAARAEPMTIAISRAPIRSLAFSERGHWLASGADTLAVWTWDEAD